MEMLGSEKRVAKLLDILDTWLNGSEILALLDQQEFAITEVWDDHISLTAPDTAWVMLMPKDRWAVRMPGKEIVQGFGNWLELAQVLSPDFRGY
jgi:hypothetical protein